MSRLDGLSAIVKVYLRFVLFTGAVSNVPIAYEY